MSERFFRLVLGAVLIVLLYFQLEPLIYAYIAVLIFEGVTNFRVPTIVSNIRYGDNTVTNNEIASKIPFDAERMLRILVAAFLIISYALMPEALWFFPWFVGFMLFMAGVTNICPMVMSLKWIGFR